MSKPIILCVDDERIVLDSLREQITRAMGDQYAVEIAEDGLEAVELINDLIAQGYEVPVVISDYIMPVMKGDELLKRVHAVAPTSMKIMLTGQASTEGVTNAINFANLYRYIEKPWEKDDLILTVTEAVRSYYKDRRLEEQNRQLIQFNQELEQMVAQRTAAIHDLLNNTGQGFLSFGADFLILPEYSRECINIIGDDIAGRNFIEILFTPAEHDFARFTLTWALLEGDQGRGEAFLSLLPQEVKINGRTIAVQYKIIPIVNETSSEKIMVILTDVTDRRILEEQIQHENKVQSMIVKVVTNYEDFAACLKEFRGYYSNELADAAELVGRSGEGAQLMQTFTEMFRNVHTFKANFAQFGLLSAPDNLHEVESHLNNIIENVRKSEMLPGQLINIIQDISVRLQKSVEQDINLLVNILGEKYFSCEDVLYIEKQKILAVEETVCSLLPLEQQAVLLSEVRRLRYKDMRDMLKGYIDYTIRLADQLGKSIHPMLITGPEIIVDPDWYRSLIEVLSHVMRNILDHEIETPDERVAVGKDERATIICKVARNNETVLLEISADGRGIDPDVIRRKAVEKEICTIEHVSAYTDEEVIALIFNDGFSTRSDVTSLSGRGVGLAAVKNVVVNLGGSVAVKTQRGERTAFVFSIPYLE